MRAFLDFEASSLAKDGYPIEVAWIFEDGLFESHLIAPAPGWTDWDDAAAAIHGIARETLAAEGLPAAQIARRVLDKLGGHLVYASSPSWDGKWLSLLLRAGGLPRHAMRLLDTDEAQFDAVAAALASVVPAAELPALARTIIDAVRAVPAPPVHRALPDAAEERRLWLEIGRRAREEADRRATGTRS